MNAFAVRERLIREYADYVRSFIEIRDPGIAARVEEGLRQGLLWPEPLLQLNPAFEPGAWIDDLVKTGALHSACSDVFRRDKSDADRRGAPLRLHKHQTEAIGRARVGQNYVLTTGTGSGKSMA